MNKDNKIKEIKNRVKEILSQYQEKDGHCFARSVEVYEAIESFFWYNEKSASRYEIKIGTDKDGDPQLIIKDDPAILTIVYNENTTYVVLRTECVFESCENEHGELVDDYII